MKDDLARLIEFVDASRVDRRAFLNRSAAFGAAAVIGASALGKPLRADEPKKGGILKMGLGGGESTDTLDPALADGPVAYNVSRQWGDTIVSVSADNKIEPRLAESISANKDGSVWTFGVRQGVKFHDGSDMTAEDVVATIQTALRQELEVRCAWHHEGDQGNQVRGAERHLDDDWPQC